MGNLMQIFATLCKYLQFCLNICNFVKVCATLCKYVQQYGNLYSLMQICGIMFKYVELFICKNCANMCNFVQTCATFLVFCAILPNHYHFLLLWCKNIFLKAVNNFFNRWYFHKKFVINLITHFCKLNLSNLFKTAREK